MTQGNEIVALNDIERRFAETYCLDFNAKKAARRVGITPQLAERLLTDHRVQTVISETKIRATGAVDISVDWVLEKLRRIVEANPVEVFRYIEGVDGQPRIGGLVDLRQVPEEIRDAIKSIKFTMNGPAVEFHDKVAALDRIGKYFGMFIDRTDLTTGGKSFREITPDMTPQQAAEAYMDTLKSG